MTIGIISLFQGNNSYYTIFFFPPPSHPLLATPKHHQVYVLLDISNTSLLGLITTISHLEHQVVLVLTAVPASTLVPQP